MKLKVNAKLDPQFAPLSVVCREMREATKENGQDLVIGVERTKGCTTVYKTRVFKDGTGHDEENFNFVERMVKALLWVAGGFKVIIAGAGMAAHLPGMCAAIFPMPVIGIPMHTTSLGGRDSLYSIVQMPSGIPVATVAINGGANAGILAAKILATSNPELLDKVKAYAQSLKEGVQKKDAKLQEVGFRNYGK